MTKKLSDLYKHRDSLELSIKWTQYALEAHVLYINTELQLLRKNTLVNLLKELELITKEIVSEEFREFELQTLSAREHTKRILAAMHVPITERQDGSILITL